MSALKAGAVAVVLGTRPEAIKLAVLVELLGDRAAVIHTGQHYDDVLGRNVTDDLGFPPAAVELGVGGTSRAAQIGRAVASLDELFEASRPAVVVVQGDTNATLAGAIAANAHGIPLVHVEAGLRSHDRAMPEEHNRVLTDHLADLCAAPTEISATNLVNERIAGERISVTGNTVVEAVARMLPAPLARQAVLAECDLEPDGYVLATFHRPENVDDRDAFATILGELARLPLPVLLPLHPRAAARATGFGLDAELARLRVVPPMEPRRFLAVAAEAACWVSDSGGLQEEASLLKRPLVTVRGSTERPEVLRTFSTLTPPGPRISELVRAWLDDLETVHAQLALVPTPYGDGSASERIAALVQQLAPPA
jgi:UDP-N-acetylglucosamine 2-epimerase (non-hydrolysing)